MRRIAPRPVPEKSRLGLAMRVAWFAGIWLLSVLALGVVAYAIRWAIKP